MQTLGKLSFVAVMLWPVAAYAQNDKVNDFYTELIEWVYGPCMEVGAASSVASFSQESKNLGIKRSQVARLMLASREKAIRQFAETLASGNKNPTWEQRREFYTPMLELCIRQQVPGLK